MTHCLFALIARLSFGVIKRYKEPSFGLRLFFKFLSMVPWFEWFEPSRGFGSSPHVRCWGIVTRASEGTARAVPEKIQTARAGDSTEVN